MPDKPRTIEIDGKMCKLCRFCDAPMKPKDVKKKPNFWDHAQGCPYSRRFPRGDKTLKAIAEQLGESHWMLMQTDGHDGASHCGCKVAVKYRKAKEAFDASRNKRPSRNGEVLTDFVKFCEANPDHRFWQALRNWSGYHFVFVADANPDLTHTPPIDTFSFEGKRAGGGE